MCIDEIDELKKIFYTFFVTSMASQEINNAQRVENDRNSNLKKNQRK